jgi:hypothetical protein
MAWAASQRGSGGSAKYWRSGKLRQPAALLASASMAAYGETQRRNIGAAKSHRQRDGWRGIWRRWQWRNGGENDAGIMAKLSWRRRRA